jgi:predicted RNase H-like HicB family nuclease
MRPYIALTHKEADSDFGVSFPDIPGCVTAGATLDKAREMATGALRLHIECVLQDGEALPEPPSLVSVVAERENRAGAAVLVSRA